MAKIILDIDINAKSAQAGLKDLEKSINALAKKVNTGKETNMDSIANSADRLRNRLLSLSLSIQSVSKNYKKGTFTNIQKELDSFLMELKTLDPKSKGYAQAIQNIAKATTVLEGDFRATRLEARNLHGSIQDIVGGFLKFQLAARVVMVPLQAIRQAWQSLNETLQETEDRILAIRRIVGTEFTSGEMATSLYKIAEQYGQTFENISEIATNFARSGLSWQETLKATEQAVVALNVAELDATAATDGLLAVMAQFKLSTSDLSSIIDEMSKASDNYLVTTDKILKALQRTGSAASNANLSLEQTIGIITALSKATNRSGENLGTAINSLIQYSSKESALNVFAGLSEDSSKVVSEYKKGAATILDVWRQVSVEIKNLKADQADLLDSYFTTEDGSTLKEMLDGELEDFYTEVGGVYDTANTFRKNYFIALLNNMDTVDEAIVKISDSAGYTQEKNAMYMDTYTAKVNTLKAKWQEVANDEQGLLGIKKDLVEIATELLTLIQRIGGIKTAILGIGTAISFFTGHPVISALGAVATIISGIVGNIKKAREEAERASREATEQKRKIVEEWTAIAQDSKNFESTYKEYKKQIEAGEDYYSIEGKVVSLLGEKANILSEVTKGTDEYTNAVIKLSEVEIAENKRKAEQARVAAEKNLSSNSFGAYSIDAELFRNAGIAVKQWQTTEKDGWFRNGQVLPYEYTLQHYGIEGLTGGTDAQSRLNDYKLYVDTANKLWDSYTKARLDADESLAKKIYFYWESVNNVVKNYEPYITDYENAIREIEAYQQKTVEHTEKIAKNLSEISDKQKDIASAVKEYRSEQEKAARIEEKQLAIEEAKKKVLEAQQALTNAYNERSTRVYNAATGEFELQASGKTIQSAQDAQKKAEENLTKAVDSLNEYVKDQAWDEVINELSSGNATNDTILEIIAKWAQYSTDKTFGNEIKSIVGEKAGFQIKSGEQIAKENMLEDVWKGVAVGGSLIAGIIGSVIEIVKNKKYDSGGVLTGLGGIKATSRPETVNDPDLTSKILSPTSNAEFTRYVKDMNLLFGASKEYASSPIINKSNAVTNNNGNTYVVNGMTITEEQAKDHTLLDIFNNFPIAG